MASKKTTLLLTALLLGACEKTSGAGGEGETQTPETAVAPLDLSTIELPVAEDPNVAYRVWFHVGAQDDPEGKEGLAWLTGQMLAQGATKSKSYDAIVEALFPLASGYDVNVDREMTVVSGRTHRDNVDAFAQLFFDAYTQPAFDPADFERIKSQGLSYLEKSLRYAQDEELGKAALRWFVYLGTPYAHPDVGTVSGLNAITLDDVKAFYASHYTADRVTFAIGGAYQPAAVQSLEATRESLAPSSDAPRVAAPQPAAIEGKHVLLVHKPGADASISFGYPIDVHRGDKDYYALWIANSWLGEHRNSASHLFQVIREKRGLNYGDYSYIEAFPQGGFRSMPPTNVARRSQLFEVWVRTLPNEHAHFALRAAHREVQKLAKQGMTQEDFELTRAFLRKYVLHFADRTSARLGYAVDDRFYGVEGSHLAKFVEMMDAMTLEDVNSAIERHLQADNLKIAIVTGEPEMLKKALSEDAPSPMTYESEKPAEVLEEDKEIAVHALGIPAGQIDVIPVDSIFE